MSPWRSFLLSFLSSHSAKHTSELERKLIDSRIGTGTRKKSYTGFLSKFVWCVYFQRSNDENGNCSGGSMEFPTTNLYELESRVFTDHWSIPYKREESLGKCLIASTCLARHGKNMPTMDELFICVCVCVCCFGNLVWLIHTSATCFFLFIFYLSLR